MKESCSKHDSDRVMADGERTIEELQNLYSSNSSDSALLGDSLLGLVDFCGRANAEILSKGLISECTEMIKDMLSFVENSLQTFVEKVAETTWTILKSALRRKASIDGVSLADIIVTSISIHDGSKSEVARKLRVVIRTFEQQLSKAEEYHLTLK